MDNQSSFHDLSSNTMNSIIRQSWQLQSCYMFQSRLWGNWAPSSGPLSCQFHLKGSMFFLECLINMGVFSRISEYSSFYLSICNHFNVKFRKECKSSGFNIKVIPAIHCVLHYINHGDQIFTQAWRTGKEKVSSKWNLGKLKLAPFFLKYLYVLFCIDVGITLVQGRRWNKDRKPVTAS